MFRLAVLTVLFLVSYGYPPKASYQPPRYQVPPPPPPPAPMPWYPYPFFPWMDWWDDEGPDHSHSREHDRDRCRRLSTSCWNANPADCSLAIIRYFHEDGRKRASIRCPNNNQMMSIVTPDNTTLSVGIGAAKIATCRNGRWQAQTTNGYLVRFSTVRCLAATTTSTTSTTSTTTSTTTTTPTTTSTTTTTPTTTTSTTTSTTTTTTGPAAEGRIR